MRVVILGCGRVGSTLALLLDSEGHNVGIVDQDPDSFRRLGEHFKGRTINGVGIDSDVLREAGIEGADAFYAVTNGDNSNIIAAQIAKIRFNVPRVLTRIYDPLRAQVYQDMGIDTLCVTTLAGGILFDRLFDRPFRGVKRYQEMTRQVRDLYGANLPTPEQVAARRAADENGRPDYIIVAGGGKVGYQLSRVLLREGYEVLLIEKRPQRYQMLERELKEALFYGDACEIRTMVRTGMERADLVVAVTGDDEDNLVIAQVAKRWFGVPRAIARVNNPRNEEIVQMLGIDESISATRLLFQLIEQEVSTSDFIPLTLLRRGNLEVVEAQLSPSSPAIGKHVRDLNLPSGCLLAAVVRNNQAQVVTGDTDLECGDSVLALADSDNVASLRRALMG